MKKNNVIDTTCNVANFIISDTVGLYAVDIASNKGVVTEDNGAAIMAIYGVTAIPTFVALDLLKNKVKNMYLKKKIAKLSDK